MAYRRGMWVKTAKDEIGILAEFLSTDVAEVHIVNDDGETEEIKKLRIVNLSEAAVDDIPKSRRPIKL